MSDYFTTLRSKGLKFKKICCISNNIEAGLATTYSLAKNENLYLKRETEMARRDFSPCHHLMHSADWTCISFTMLNVKLNVTTLYYDSLKDLLLFCSHILSEI